MVIDPFLDEDKHLLVSFSLGQVQHLAAFFHLPEVSFDVEGARLNVGLVVPDRLQLLLEQDHLV